MSEKQKELLKDLGKTVKKLDEKQQNYIAGYAQGLADAKVKKGGEE